MVQFTMSQYCFKWLLGDKPVIVWTNDSLVHWHIHMYHSTLMWALIEAEIKWPPFSRWHFEMVFFNENIWVSIKISLNFVPKGQINNISALVQIMAWRPPGIKPLSEPMMASLLTHASLGFNELTHYYHMVSWIFAIIRYGNGLAPVVQQGYNRFYLSKKYFWSADKLVYVDSHITRPPCGKPISAFSS